MTMRVFLMLMIFAIGFSGYSAAAHAYGDMGCQPNSKAEVVDQVMDMGDCLGHQEEGDTQNNTDKTSSKSMDCTHCCASHAINLSYYSMNIHALAAVLNPPPQTENDGDYLFSLLRPPKFFV